MFRSALSRCLGMGTIILLGVMLAAVPALAQMQQTAPSPIAPRAPVEKQPVDHASMGLLEGNVKNVDPGAGTLQVSYGPFGIFRRTIEVNNDTFIQVEGREATLADIREGETVRASYERRESKDVATSVEVLPIPESTKNRPHK